MNDNQKRLADRMARIKAVVYDFDGTLFQLSPAIFYDFNIAAAQAAVRMKPELQLEQAVVDAKESYREFRSSGEIFVRRDGLCRNEFHARAHEEMSVNNIPVCDELPKLFAQHRRPKGILSAGGRDYLERGVARLRLTDAFPSSSILAREDGDHLDKAESPKPIKLWLDRFGVKANEVAFLEDTPLNHGPAKGLGVMTVLILHDRIHHASTLPWTDFVLDRPHDFLRIENAVPPPKRVGRSMRLLARASAPIMQESCG